MGRRLLQSALVGLAAAVLAGCGSTTVHHVTTTITRAGSSSSTSSTSTAASTAGTTTSSSTTRSPALRPSPLAGKSASQVLALSAQALRHSHGYLMRGNLTAGKSRLRITLTTTGPRTFDATTTTGSTVIEVVSLPAASYLRGNAAFWRHQAGASRAARARARTLANHWVQVPAASARAITKSLGSLAPATLARCLTEDHGRLTLAGHTTVDGIRALVLKDAGDAPGATPSTLAVAASGPPYPLRYVASGRTRAGGRVDVCNDGKGSDNRGTLDFSQFGSISPIQPPTGAQSSPGGPVA